MYMQARYYDPVIGRFMSNDPIGFRDVHSFNRYTYANNNPYKYVDPDGRAPDHIRGKRGRALARLFVPKKHLKMFDKVTRGSKIADLVDQGKIKQATALINNRSTKKTYFSKEKRLEAHKKANGDCEYCGKKTQTDTPFKKDSAEGDHFIPQSKGGKTTPEQLVNSCCECNGPSDKGNKMPGSEWQPKNPNPRIRDKMDKL